MFAKDIKQLIDGIVRPPIIKGQENGPFRSRLDDAAFIGFADHILIEAVHPVLIVNLRRADIVGQKDLGKIMLVHRVSNGSRLEGLGNPLLRNGIGPALCRIAENIADGKDFVGRIVPGICFRLVLEGSVCIDVDLFLMDPCHDFADKGGIRKKIQTEIENLSPSQGKVPFFEDSVHDFIR